MQKTLPCPKCEKNCTLNVVWYGDALTSVTGQQCPVGPEYARSQVIVVKAIVSSSVRVENSPYPLLPVRTDKPVDKAKTLDIIRESGKILLKAPIRNGQVVARNIAGSGADLVATRAAEVK